jgi:hypothetical protein
VFDYAANHSNAPQILPSVDYAKKKNPVYSLGRAKQFTLWDQEEKKSFATPGPLTYNQDDTSTKMTRFKAISLGMDVKSN